MQSKLNNDSKRQVDRAMARWGRRMANAAPGVHGAYVGAATKIAAVLGDPAKAEAFVAQCQSVNCELLRTEPDPWCGACGCPAALKSGCPQGRWK